MGPCFFTKEKLISEIEPIGFNSFEFYGDIAGQEFQIPEKLFVCFYKVEFSDSEPVIYSTHNEIQYELLTNKLPYTKEQITSGIVNPFQLYFRQEGGYGMEYLQRMNDASITLKII